MRLDQAEKMYPMPWQDEKLLEWVERSNSPWMHERILNWNDAYPQNGSFGNALLYTTEVHMAYGSSGGRGRST